VVTVAVIIATYRRPDDVARCLDAIALQTREPDELVVVDASPDDRTRDLVAARTGVVYLRNEAGMGTLPTSRAIGVAGTTSDVVAFLDDDSIVRPTWLENLVKPYADPRVGAVGGRVVNDPEEVAAADPTQVGRLLPDGRLTGNFAADPGRVLKVDHLLGANMSYRRTAAASVGGIHEFYPGTSAREDSDMGLRMTRQGWDVMFAPDAAVDHVSGEYAKGRRFDRRYQFYTQRNHVVLLSRVFGLRSPYLRHYPSTVLREAAGVVRGSLDGTRVVGRRTPYQRVRSLVAGVTRVGADLAGLTAGALAAIRLRVRLGKVPAPGATPTSVSDSR
jgi:GT2 family glycosyltransferase